MKVRNQTKPVALNRTINFDALCREFDGGSFYGLEYILDDISPNKKRKPTPPARSSIDWFGLYN